MNFVEKMTWTFLFFCKLLRCWTSQSIVIFFSNVLVVGRDGGGFLYLLIGPHLLVVTAIAAMLFFNFIKKNDLAHKLRYVVPVARTIGGLRIVFALSLFLFFGLCIDEKYTQQKRHIDTHTHTSIHAYTLLINILIISYSGELRRNSHSTFLRM